MKHIFFTPERICALSDGVYAIVLTLLVLELKVPETTQLSEQALEEILYEQRLKFAAYLVSFFAISKFWVDHHAVFNVINKANLFVLWTNFIHLLFISLLPFSSSLIGEFAGNHLAQFIFVVTLVLCGLSQALIMGYALRCEHLVSSELSWQLRINQFRKILFIPGVAVISAVFSLFHYHAMFVLWMLAPLALVLMNRFLLTAVDPCDSAQTSNAVAAKD